MIFDQQPDRFPVVGLADYFFKIKIFLVKKGQQVCFFHPAQIENLDECSVPLLLW